MSLPAGVGATGARWLFSEHFLAERLPGWPEFAEIDVARLREELLAVWESERAALAGANEGETEERLVRPVLRALGHQYALFQPIPETGRTPDYFLYSSEAERQDARIERAVAVADAKRFDRLLDRRGPDGDPVAQIRDYVQLSRRPFGVLTNGRTWRLYARDVALVERATHEVDLVKLLEHGDAADLRYFAAFFGADAFRPGADGRTFLERALDDSMLHAVAVSDALQGAVFAALPKIATGFLDAEPHTPEALEDARANALVFLYRVLFCLFAEARELLPIGNPSYRDYSIAAHRLKVARLLDQGASLSTTDRLYAELRALFRMIHAGDEALGVTEYDGGLFDPDAHPWLEARSVPDALLATALDGLYRVDRELVDYRNLSVRTLGTVYERLLAWDLAEHDGQLVLVESPRRHEMGAYFTPEEIVDAIVARTLDPIVARRSAEVAERALEGEAALDALLDVRVLDPAIGSGHFLVGAVDFLAQAIATDPSYDGDLSLNELRRLVAERCLYGVDLSELAVELARLSLWLVTARIGEPLTFLANLRVGDSLVGADTGTLLDAETGLIEAHIAAHAGELLRQANELIAHATRSGADAREKKRIARELEALRLPLEVFADESLQRFMPPGGRPRFHWPLEFPELFVDEYGRPRPDGGFDAVIGNPPYIRVQEIGREIAEYCRRRFSTAYGSFDAYAIFLERGLSLLAPRGRLGFIVPNKFFKLEFAQRLRAMLSESELVDEVVDFGATQVFAGTTNYTCILILDRQGVSDLSYSRLSGDRAQVLSTLSTGVGAAPQRFRTRALDGDPWILVPPEEAAVIRAATDRAERLDGVVDRIFTGLQTNADAVYILEYLEQRRGNVVLWSAALNQEVELEPTLLHPLASGEDIERYSMHAINRRLLFPYVRDKGGMRLVTDDELRKLPRTFEYLKRNEVALRARERSRMDHDRWYAFVYPKSLDAHVRPKLGIAATVRRLEVAADFGGGIHFHNVRVNGILGREAGVPIAFLLAVLNARLLDWLFRRGSTDLANGYFTANKQFISGLPIQIDRVPEVVELGQSLHRFAAQISEERGGFVSWLASTIGARSSLVGRVKAVRTYEALAVGQLVTALATRRAAFRVDPRERAVRGLIEREHMASVARLLPLLAQLRAAEAEADDVVYELYRLPTAMRKLVDAEYE